MCRDRRRHYDDGFMRVVADLIRGGAGRRSLARRLGVPVSTAGKWVLSYRFGGEAALMGEREGNRRYDYETKLAAVREEIQQYVDKANATVSRAESVRKFAVLDTQFTQENKCLTPSLKVVRPAVDRVFADVIDNEIYNGKR